MSTGTPQNAPGPDWYPDPATPGQLRFWDGTAWTAHTKPSPPLAPMTPVQNAAPVTQGPRRKLANRAAGFGMVGVLLFTVGILLPIVSGQTPLTLALVVTGAIVFVVSLVLCIVFTVLKR